MNTPNRNEFKPQPGDALLIVDVQNDFLPGGSLAVPRGDEVVPVLNRYLRNLSQSKTCRSMRRATGIRRLTARSARRAGRGRRTAWQEQTARQFAAALQLPPAAVIISKATTPEQDAYSGFQGTDLDAGCMLPASAGCSSAGSPPTTACSTPCAMRCGSAIEVLLLGDAIRAVDVQPGDGQRAEEEMLSLGAQRITVEGIAA